MNASEHGKLCAPLKKIQNQKSIVCVWNLFSCFVIDWIPKIYLDSTKKNWNTLQYLCFVSILSMKDGPTLAKSMNTGINCCRHVNDFSKKKNRIAIGPNLTIFSIYYLFTFFRCFFPCVYLYAYDVNVELKSMAMKRSFIFSFFVGQHSFEVHNTQSADNKTAWIGKFHHLRISIVFNQYYMQEIFINKKKSKLPFF